MSIKERLYNHLFELREKQANCPAEKRAELGQVSETVSLSTRQKEKNMTASYCSKHQCTTTADNGECYMCFQSRLWKEKQDAHNADLLKNPPAYVYETWGWEQTNATFFKVTRKTAKSLFGIEVVGKCLGEDGFMTGMAVPTDEIKGTERKINLKKVDRYETPVRISWYG